MNYMNEGNYVSNKGTKRFIELVLGQANNKEDVMEEIGKDELEEILSSSGGHPNPDPVIPEPDPEPEGILYTEFTYTLNDEDDIITLHRYNGDDTDVYIPASYVIDGKSYNVTLGDNRENTSTMADKGLFSNNQLIESVQFADGIKLSSGAYMFYRCKLLTSIQFGKIDTTECNDMQYMFNTCSLLHTIDLSLFNTTNVTTMYSMFSDMKNITKVDISSFDTGKVENMSYMFSYDNLLSEIIVGDKFSTGMCTSMENMFYNCKSITSDILNSILNRMDTTHVNSMRSMFYGCIALDMLDFSKFNDFDTSEVEIMSEMFYGCTGLKLIDLSTFNTDKVTSMYRMFRSVGTSETTIKFPDNFGSACRDMSGMFYDSNMKSLDLTSFDTSQVTDMDSMFYNCTQLTSVILSSFNTAKVTNFETMFYDCGAITSLDLTSFDTNNVTNMNRMFWNCKKLTTIKVSSGKWMISSGCNTNLMFYDCGTSKVTYA